MSFLIGFIVGAATAFLVQRFFPAKWSRATKEVNEAIDEQLK